MHSLTPRPSPTQEREIKNLLKRLKRGDPFTIILAPFQAGKTMIVTEVLKRLHSSGRYPKLPLNVCILMGPNLTSLRNQIAERFTGTESKGLSDCGLIPVKKGMTYSEIKHERDKRFNVWACTHASIRNIHERFPNKKQPILFIVDEVHWLLGEDGIVQQELRALGIDLRKNRFGIHQYIGMSATPFPQMEAELRGMIPCDSILKISAHELPGYTSLKDLLHRSRIIDTRIPSLIDGKMTTSFKRALQLAKKIKKCFIVRIPSGESSGSELRTEIFNEFPNVFQVREFSTKDEDLSALQEMLYAAPSIPTVCLIKQAWNAGITLDAEQSKNISGVWESTTEFNDDNIELMQKDTWWQRFARHCGFGKKHLDYPIYAPRPLFHRAVLYEATPRIEVGTQTKSTKSGSKTVYKPRLATISERLLIHGDTTSGIGSLDGKRSPIRKFLESGTFHRGGSGRGKLLGWKCNGPPHDPQERKAYFEFIRDYAHLFSHKPSKTKPVFVVFDKTTYNPHVEAKKTSVYNDFATTHASNSMMNRRLKK